MPVDGQEHCTESSENKIDTIPGKLVNIVNSKSGLLTVQVEINGHQCRAVVDSGAEKSLISSGLASKLDLTINNNDVNVFSVLGGQFSARGSVQTRLSVSGVEMSSLVLVVFEPSPNTVINLLLGRDFLSVNCIELDIESLLFTKHCDGNSRIEIYMNELGEGQRVLLCNFPCYAREEVRLNTGAMHAIPVLFDLPRIAGDHMLYYSDAGGDGKLPDKVHGLDGICDATSRRVFLMATDSAVTLKKGEIIGSINSVCDLSDQGTGGSELIGEPTVDHAELRAKLSEADLSDQERAAVGHLLEHNSGVFGSSDGDIGLASVTQHRINLTDDTPIYQRPRRFPPPITDEVERQCRELEAADIIEPSDAAWSSPIVPVRKKDGSIRMCVDYRKLNSVTIPDKFPVPNLLDSIYGLYGTKFFSRLDLIRGFYQLPIHPESRPFTAFSTQRNHWQFKRLSFGLRNAPSAFQREIQSVLSSLPSHKVIVYIDDILIMGSSFNEHLSLLSKVLETLSKYNIKLKLSKCDFFRSEVEFLGHLVSSSGIKKTPAYINKITEYPIPENVGQLREFLGLINFQRKFLPNCSSIQKPLSVHTSGSRSRTLNWTPEMLAAFEQLKQEMLTDLELAFPDYSDGAAKLELWVDASATGAGAYLAQQQNGMHRVIGFISMTFTPTQMSYSTLERELTALRWGVKTFRPFLYGMAFTLYTDHQPLVHLHNMKLVCSRLARTVEELADYVFDICYVPGHVNSAADALSRLNCKLPVIVAKDTHALPTGLIMNGAPSPGGGDSLFHSLSKSLTRLSADKAPVSEEELRVQLVEELLGYPERYGLKLDRQSRKALRLMKHPGQLPCLDVLLAASKLYKIKVFVYFWPSNPVIYQVNDYPDVVHLQCVSGVHFNSLIELRGFVLPNAEQCSVSSVPTANSDRDAYASRCPVEPESACDDSAVSCVPVLLAEQMSCCHRPGSSPLVPATVGDLSFCAVLDTGAEISLVTDTVLSLISSYQDINVVRQNVCNIVGFTGCEISIKQTVELRLAIGSFLMGEPHVFAVIPDSALPHCLLLGLDFMRKNGIGVDFKTNTCKRRFITIAPFLNTSGCQSYNSLMMISVDGGTSHKVRSRLVNRRIGFEVEGPSSDITGLSLLMEGDLVKHLQSRSDELRALYRCVKQGIQPKNWPGKISSYRRFAGKISISDNNVLVFCDLRPVIIVPCNVVVELALVLHVNFAHSGRDKLIALLGDLVWHPSRYQVVSDVCTTCHSCQLTKEFSTPLVPPTLKIETSYPFELVAADLMSLPKTSTGFVGCLVIVDHYSKWASAVPIRNKQSGTIVRALKHQVLPFLPSMPSSLLTDNGPEFTSSEFCEFLDDCNITHKFTTPYCPTSNGAVERVNRTIQGLLRSIVEKQHVWDQDLPRALVAYNNTLHSELGMSPCQFLLSRSHVVRLDPPLQSNLGSRWKLGHPKFLPFAVGQYVLKKIEQIGSLNANKLSKTFTGPYKVIKVNDNGITYQLMDESTAAVIRAHHSKLRIYRKVPAYIARHPLYKDLCGNASEAVDGCNYRMDDIACSAGFAMDTDDESSSSSCRNSYLSINKSNDSIHVDDNSSEGGCVTSAFLADWYPPGPQCKGCQYEAQMEMNTSINRNSCAVEPAGILGVAKLNNRGINCVDESIQTEPVDLSNLTSIEPLHPLTVFEWDFSMGSGSNWSLPSMNNEKVEESIVDADECSGRQSGGSQLFEGFTSDYGLGNKLCQLRRVVSQGILGTSTSCSGSVDSPRNSIHRIQTRSRGSVPDLPNVQGRILEHRRRQNYLT